MFCRGAMFYIYCNCDTLYLIFLVEMKLRMGKGRESGPLEKAPLRAVLADDYYITCTQPVLLRIRRACEALASTHVVLRNTPPTNDF